MPTQLKIWRRDDEVIVDVQPSYRPVPMSIGALLIGFALAIAWLFVCSQFVRMLHMLLLILLVPVGFGLLYTQVIIHRIRFRQRTFTTQVRFLSIPNFGRRWSYEDIRGFGYARIAHAGGYPVLKFRSATGRHVWLVRDIRESDAIALMHLLGELGAEYL